MKPVEELLRHQKLEHTEPYYPLRKAKKGDLKLEILTLAADLAIRICESRHIILVNAVSSAWELNGASSRRIKVTLNTHGPLEDDSVYVYVFDGPSLVADNDIGIDLFEKYHESSECLTS